ncbi:MAG: lysophospholipase L1-like esterase [Chitinophagales bacterium]
MNKSLSYRIEPFRSKTVFAKELKYIILVGYKLPSMIKKLLFVFVLIFSLHSANAQCSEQDEVKVLLIGDSWAFFMGVDGTFNNVYESWGHNNVKFLTTLDVAVNGARTTDFLTSNMQTDIRNIITLNPDIDVIHLSIAGNDVLGQWDVSFTQTELDALIDEVYSQTDSIIRFLKTLKPGMKIVFSGYVYPNFEEVIVDANPLGNNHPFYSRWEGMGFPSFLEINTILNDFSELIEDYADADPQVEFFKVPGLLQYTFGQTVPLAVAPGGSYAPFTQAMPFGDPSYPSPQKSMRDYFGITRDCFHLSPKGYRDLIGYHTQKFYHKFFMDDQYLFANSSVNGSISSMQGVSNDLMLGVSAGEEFGAILDFNTQDMNWDAVGEAEIFLQVKSLYADNPLNEALRLSIVAGNLGSTAMVEGADWTASVDAEASACVFGNKNNVDNWIRIKVPSEFMAYLKNNSNTQFLLQSSNTVEGIIEFNNTNDPDFAPVLNLKYDETYVGIQQVFNDDLILLFPNPAQDYIKLRGSKSTIYKVLIYNALGQVVLEHSNRSKIYVGDLPPAYYRVMINTSNEVVVKSFLKN